MSEWAFVALGSNVGHRSAFLAQARRALGRLPDTDVVAASAVEETEPLGSVPQAPYLNQMVLLRTGLAPRDLLDRCLSIEQEAGRERRERWGPRTLDLDIVEYGDWVVSEPGLEIPHPQVRCRDFWQRELAELRSHAR